MKDFYYQIKTKLANPGVFSYLGGKANWSFPPMFSGKVTALNNKDAKAIIEEEYGRKFPLRVLQEDLATNEFLLSIQEIKPGSHIERLFERSVCAICSNTFYVIDKYNDFNCKDKGPYYCSDDCKQKHLKQLNY